LVNKALIPRQVIISPKSLGEVPRIVLYYSLTMFTSGLKYPLVQHSIAWSGPNLSNSNGQVNFQISAGVPEQNLKFVNEQYFQFKSRLILLNCLPMFGIGTPITFIHSCSYSPSYSPSHLIPLPSFLRANMSWIIYHSNRSWRQI
jgi:hypothetical protein